MSRSVLSPPALFANSSFAAVGFMIFLALSAILFPGAFSPTAARESGGDRSLAQSDCPRAGLRVIFEDAVTENDLIAAINREQQILVLCQERQALINSVLEREHEYRKLIGENRAETGKAALSPQSAPDPRSTLDPRSGELWDDTANNAAALPSAPDDRIPAPPPISLQGPQSLTGQVAPDYSWYTLYGSGDNLTVGVQTSSGHWLRQQGGELPGGWRVVALHAKPVRITLKRGDQQIDLPYVRRDLPGRGANAADAESLNDAAIEALLEGRR